jgi:acetyltransferase
VTDAWQGKGVGGLLTDACVEIGREWGLATIVAETTPDNSRMIETFRRRGFAIEHDLEAGVVMVRLELR